MRPIARAAALLSCLLAAPVSADQHVVATAPAQSLAAKAMVPAQSVSASAVGFLCLLRVTNSQSWVPPVVFIAYDPENGRVVISDPIALFHNGGLPVLGKLAMDSKARLSFTWDYPVGMNAQQTRKMLYRAGIDKATGRVTVTAIPAGFDAIFQADGQCEVQSLNELAAEP
ncbi:hypothetical protein PVT71_12495 [Salipiger sp. H15]|uniref:Uncharacterized protein n=1 Tax=Alloyangia sp. H15 TaxID=3029062 RepID=A0AAU8AEX0_9RHOB